MWACRACTTQTAACMLFAVFALQFFKALRVLTAVLLCNRCAAGYCNATNVLLCAAMQQMYSFQASLDLCCIYMHACTLPGSVAALCLCLQQMYSFQASLGWLDLQDVVKKEFGETHKYTALVPDLSGGC